MLLAQFTILNADFLVAGVAISDSDLPLVSLPSTFVLTQRITQLTTKQQQHRAHWLNHALLVR